MSTLKTFPMTPGIYPFQLKHLLTGVVRSEAQLNAPKLMNFLVMPTTTTMLIKLKGDLELVEMLTSFLNNELAINLDTLHEAPIKLWPPQHLPKANVHHKFTPTKDDLVDHDPKSLFRLRTLGDYLKSDESNAVLLGCMQRQCHSRGTRWRSRCEHCHQTLLGENGPTSNGCGRPSRQASQWRVSQSKFLGLLRNLRVKIWIIMYIIPLQ